MRAGTAGAFVLGCAFGALCLGVVLWRSGSLVPVGAVKQAPAATVATTLPPPPEQSLGDVMADLERQTPPPQPPPAVEPFDFAAAARGGTEGGALPPVPIGPRPFIGPRAPVAQGEADRIAPDRLGAPHLAMPISGIDPRKLGDNFNDVRGGAKHEALDIMAPRGTPVRAVAQGNVAKLFTSKAGGLTVYQFDDSRSWCYYYAHLDRYAAGLKDGTLLRAGEVLGYVGSTGNASASAPHLHFAVFKLGPEKKWWEGTAIDPLPLLK